MKTLLYDVARTSRVARVSAAEFLVLVKLRVVALADPSLVLAIVSWL